MPEQDWGGLVLGSAVEGLDWRLFGSFYGEGSGLILDGRNLLFGLVSRSSVCLFCLIRHTQQSEDIHDWIDSRPSVAALFGFDWDDVGFFVFWIMVCDIRVVCFGMCFMFWSWWSQIRQIEIIGAALSLDSCRGARSVEYLKDGRIIRIGLDY